MKRRMKDCDEHIQNTLLHDIEYLPTYIIQHIILHRNTETKFINRIKYDRNQNKIKCKIKYNINAKQNETKHSTNQNRTN